jgi:hypothetical protein
MTLRERGHKIFSFFQQHPQSSLHQAAEETGMSKTAVFRQKQAIARRNRHPESWLWETEVGRKWLVVLVCATVYFFGIRGGVGMPMIAEFFLAIRLTTHVGVSPRSLARIATQIEELILQYEQVHGTSKANGIQVIAGADETFFDTVILILMDLDSGFILAEVMTEDRTFLTWQDRARQALVRVGVTVRCLVSDQAKALSKLALEELHCRKIPDLFHALHEVVKLLGGRFARKAASLQRQITKAQVTIATLRHQGTAPAKLVLHEQFLTDLRAAHTRILDGQTRYYEALHALSLLVHPFSLHHHPQSAQEVESAVMHTLETLQALANEYDIADSKQRLKKVRKQVPDIAAQVDLWWLWVTEALTTYDLPPELEAWLREILLPSVYWQRQMKCTAPGPLRTAYQQAATQAQQRLDAHMLTGVLHSKELTRWQCWATGMVGKFQRTSSAVEGRNGVLSRMNHTQRSIRPQRLKVATVIHNFGIRREDGTTAAERLFGAPFPDLFDWIVDHMGELPLPRGALAPAS